MNTNLLSFTRFTHYLIFPHKLYEFHFWGALIGAVISYIGASEQKNKEEKARQQQYRMTGSQVDIANRQQDIAEEEYARFLKDYAPVEKDIAELAKKGPNYKAAKGRAVSDVEQAFAKKEGIRRRAAGRYGLNPASGRFAGMERSGELNRARTQVAATDQARQTEEDKAFSRKLAAAQLGRNLPVNASSMLTSASRGYGDVGAQYGQTAQEFARGAGKGYGAAGYWGARAFDEYNNSGKSNGTYGYNDNPAWEGSNYVENSDTGDLGW